MCYVTIRQVTLYFQIIINQLYDNHILLPYNNSLPIWNIIIIFMHPNMDHGSGHNKKSISNYQTNHYGFNWCTVNLSKRWNTLIEGFCSLLCIRIGKFHTKCHKEVGFCLILLFFIPNLKKTYNMKKTQHSDREDRNLVRPVCPHTEIIYISAYT